VILVPLHFHDRPAFPWQLPTAVVLVVLLATLATFQYRWLGEVSEAERARMRDSLRTRATDFTQEFDRELTRLYLGFQVDGDLIEKDPGGVLADALARAQGGAATAGVVKEVFLLEAQGPHAGALERVDAASRTLQPAEWPEAMAAWRRRTAPVAPLAPGMPPPIFMTDVVDAETPALVIPVPRIKRLEDGSRHTFTVMPDPGGISRVIVVWLDADRLQRQLLQPLVAKYFGAGETSEYVVAIVRRDDPSRIVYASPADARVDENSADVTAGLFDLRMDEVSRVAGTFGLKAGLPRVGAPADRVATDRVAITIVRRAAVGDGSRVLMAGGEGQRAWHVRVRHRSGSLEAIVAQSRRRNLAISLGVLGLLGASLILVIAAAQRQQRLARQQMEFVAAVSHELRTPLAVICSAGENLADGVVADGAQVKRYGSLIETEGRRLGDMVERVLQFAGIGSGAHARARAEVDLAQVIARAVDGVVADARDRGVSVTVHPHGALPPIVGDADALRSAIQNIVGNAVKYSANGGSVEVSTDRLDNPIVRIRVVDRGIGIDARDLPHVFKPFYRGRRAVDAQVRGTGVGLSVVQHVIRAHGGDIRVDSRVGEGTTVTVVLPAVTASDRSDGRGAVVRLRRGAAGTAS
jgi:signal transduction histidine kinase